jgi:hypothetical protein
MNRASNSFDQLSLLFSFLQGGAYVRLTLILLFLGPLISAAGQEWKPPQELLKARNIYLDAPGALNKDEWKTQDGIQRTILRRLDKSCRSIHLCWTVTQDRKSADLILSYQYTTETGIDTHCRGRWITGRNKTENCDYVVVTVSW